MGGLKLKKVRNNKMYKDFGGWFGSFVMYGGEIVG
jgi:hypothetical protein